MSNRDEVIANNDKIKALVDALLSKGEIEEANKELAGLQIVPGEDKYNVITEDSKALNAIVAKRKPLSIKSGKLQEGGVIAEIYEIGNGPLADSQVSALNHENTKGKVSSFVTTIDPTEFRNVIKLAGNIDGPIAFTHLHQDGRANHFVNIYRDEQDRWIFDDPLGKSAKEYGLDNLGINFHYINKEGRVIDHYDENDVFITQNPEKDPATARECGIACAERVKAFADARGSQGLVDFANKYGSDGLSKEQFDNFRKDFKDDMNRYLENKNIGKDGGIKYGYTDFSEIAENRANLNREKVQEEAKTIMGECKGLIGPAAEEEKKEESSSHFQDLVNNKSTSLKRS